MDFESAIVRKAAWRILPIIMICYFAAFLDRVNIGFAALTMNKDLGFTASQFGFGAGIFFLGYVLFELPSNIVLSKVGARRWIARILITWAILSAATAFVWNPASFYVVRILLGAAEAGFFFAGFRETDNGLNINGLPTNLTSSTGSLIWLSSSVLVLVVCA